jgi:enoyl-CoA hydratase/carnithine racemase
MTDRLLAKKDGAIGRLIFNNPGKLNAISLDMWQALGDHMADFDADPQIRVIIVSGAGGKSFIAGADVSKYEEERMGEDSAEHYARTGEIGLKRLYVTEKVTIAAINGFCIGGGISVAVSCDIRICTPKSLFGQPAARYGIGYRYSSLRRVVDIIGAAATKELLLGGGQFDANAAAAKGMVSRVVPEEEFEAHIEKLASSIAAGAPLTLKQIKFTLNEIVKDPAERNLDACEEMFQTCYASDDYREGIRAFAEKRKPVFHGK